MEQRDTALRDGANAGLGACVVGPHRCGRQGHHGLSPWRCPSSDPTSRNVPGGRVRHYWRPRCRRNSAALSCCSLGHLCQNHCDEAAAVGVFRSLAVLTDDTNCTLHVTLSRHITSISVHLMKRHTTLEDRKPQPPIAFFLLSFQRSHLTSPSHTAALMIRFFLLQNRQGKTRLSKYYVPPPDDQDKGRLEAEIHRLVLARDAKHTNFIEFRSYKIIYRRYAGLFFILGVDVTANELLCLETIHLFVELLDQQFSNVCELDIVFNFNKVYSMLDEYILGGEIQETSKREMLERIRELEKLD